MYEFGKAKEARQEHTATGLEYDKLKQHFASNPMLKESLETRKAKAEENARVAMLNYAKAASLAEPILRQWENASERAPDDESIRRIVKAEIKNLISRDNYVTFGDLKADLSDLDKRHQKEWSADIRAAVNKEIASYARKTEVEKLSEQVKEMRTRERTASGSETARDMDHRIIAHAKEIEQLKLEIAKGLDKQHQALLLVKQSVAPKNESSQPPAKRIQISGAQSDNVVKVCSVLPYLTS